MPAFPPAALPIRSRGTCLRGGSPPSPARGDNGNHRISGAPVSTSTGSALRQDLDGARQRREGCEDERRAAPPPRRRSARSMPFSQVLSTLGPVGRSGPAGDALNHVTADKARRLGTSGAERPHRWLRATSRDAKRRPTIRTRQCTSWSRPPREVWRGLPRPGPARLRHLAHRRASATSSTTEGSTTAIPSSGSRAWRTRPLGIRELRIGVVSRGILLDIPRARGVDFLEPGEPICYCRSRTGGVRGWGPGRAGDVGDAAHRPLARWCEVSEASRRGLAGLDASCLPWLHSRGVAALGCDGVSTFCLRSRRRVPAHSLRCHRRHGSPPSRQPRARRSFALASPGGTTSGFRMAIAPLVLQQHGTARR